MGADFFQCAGAQYIVARADANGGDDGYACLLGNGVKPRGIIDPVYLPEMRVWKLG